MTIPSEEDYIRVICPDCGRNTHGVSGAYCSCGWKLPFAFIIPYDAQWEYDDELIFDLKRYTALRLMGRYTGSNPEQLAELSHAQYLYLSRYPKFSFEYLSGFCDLEILELDFTSIDSLNGLQRLTAMKSLSLTECRKVTDVSALAECRELTVLNIALCKKLTDLDAVKSCTQLLHFKYEGRQLQSLNFLNQLYNLRTLILNAKVISQDIGPIIELGLERLLVKKRSFAKADLERFQLANPQCTLTFL